ncbi:TlyA family RNA methyltransferase [Cyanobacterium sp. uoEpiScrs1]|uniref:TlyA family RNA methyltransferase n=1 Tax=Cyanobacterium sp. uoEpiScrs1 TaxID=2976343 RepID=UPI00226A376D|nr:TlyA family RNA methyltransferase [Cyanobacterium sp. uoEpiScrs1]
MSKQRLDILLVNRKLCSSRQEAQGFIRAGEVRVYQQVIDKPGTQIDTTADIQLQAKARYVSRGGFKLEKALKTFNIAIPGRICLDGGISTGGFTDCLLQSGAKQIYGVDVGYGQVAWRLRQDERVLLRERTNFRYLIASDLYGNSPQADLGVMDVSFISLTKLLGTLWNLLVIPKEVILLIKPQFEVGRSRVGKKGVVRNPKDHAQAINQVLQAACSLGWYYHGLTESPITGPAGNVEYLLWLRCDQHKKAPQLKTIEEFTSSILNRLS